MKITADGLELHGNITVEVPEHMVVLSADEVNYAKSCDDLRIISCGIHPASKELVSIDQRGRVYTASCSVFFGRNFDIVSAVPTCGGTRVEFDITAAVVEADVEDILKSSRRADESEFTIDIKV